MTHRLPLVQQLVLMSVRVCVHLSAYHAAKKPSTVQVVSLTEAAATTSAAAKPAAAASNAQQVSGGAAAARDRSAEPSDSGPVKSVEYATKVRVCACVCPRARRTPRVAHYRHVRIQHAEGASLYCLRRVCVSVCMYVCVTG